MNPDPLETFRTRLGDWIEGLLTTQRYPFRRLDRRPRLMTAAGVREPDLVLWVNRDSFMAGGLLLVPRQESAAAIENGRLCASALGLRHFLTWGKQEIVFWEAGPDGVLPHRRLTAPPPGSAAGTFKTTLGTALDELKYLAVASSPPPEELSTECLVNLCRFTLDDLQPVILEVLRMLAARTGSYESSLALCARQARNKGLLTLVRILALLHYELLPGTVHPEAMERALLFALDSLPGHLHRALAPLSDEIPLPLEAAIRCHLFLRRAIQLDFCRSPLRAAETLESLLASEGPGLGLGKSHAATPNGGEAWLLVNRPPATFGVADWECAPTAALASSALLRDLTDQPPAAGQTDDLFTPMNLPCPARIEALLQAEPPLSRAERARAETCLRLSWPSRRASLPAGAPRWAWELLHLGGMIAPAGILQARTPADWLRAPFAPVLLEWLLPVFDFEKLEREEDGCLSLRLRRTEHPEASLVVCREGTERFLERALLESSHPSCVALALHLPEDLWTRILDRELQIPAAPEDWPRELEREVLLFTRSSLGRQLWRAIARHPRLPPADRLERTILQRGLPLPDRRLLKQLTRIVTAGEGTLPDQARIDAELAPWFGQAAQWPEPATGTCSKGGERASRSGGVSDIEIRDLAASTFKDGLPRFPEHYLFDHYRPSLRGFRFAPPLTRREEFFGRIRFEDAAGEILDTPDPVTAEALELVAASGRGEVELPTDAALNQRILDRYRRDLAKLHRNLLQEAHRRFPASAQAGQAAARAWRSRGLPDPGLFASGESDFPAAEKLLE